MKVQEAVMPDIDVKQAIKLAKEFAAMLYEPEQISQLGLEAVERTEDGKHWLVTLGFSRPWSRPRRRRQDPLKSPLEQALEYSTQIQKDREYKVLRVDAQTGEVVSMEIFE